MSELVEVTTLWEMLCKNCGQLVYLQPDKEQFNETDPCPLCPFLKCSFGALEYKRTVTFQEIGAQNDSPDDSPEESDICPQNVGTMPTEGNEK